MTESHELEALLAERVERERIIQLELADLRRQVEVRDVRIAALEEHLADARAMVDWLQRRVDAGVVDRAKERLRRHPRLLQAAKKVSGRG